MLLFFLISFVLSFDFDIIHTNDLHSQFNGIGPDIALERSCGGFSRLSSQIRRIQKERKHSTLTLDCGDFFSGSLFHLISSSIYFPFSPEFDFLDYLNYDAVVTGNHEFDGGFDIFKHVVRKSKGDRVPILTTNLLFNEELSIQKHNLSFFNPPKLLCHSSPSIDECQKMEAYFSKKGIDAPFFTDFLLKELKDEQNDSLFVGIIGLHGPTSRKVTAQYNREGIHIFGYDEGNGVDMGEYAQFVHRYVLFLRESFDLDVVICISHSGEPEDEDLINRLNKLSPNQRLIDAHLSAHTHHSYTTVHSSGTIISQNKGYSLELGHLRIRFEKENGSLILLNPSETHIPLTERMPRDPFMDQKIEQYTRIFESLFYPKIESFFSSDHYYYLPSDAFSNFTSRYSTIEWMSKCVFENLNKELLLMKREKNDSSTSLVDVYIFAHEFGRIDKEMIWKYENKTRILFSDLFRWYGVSNLRHPITKNNWIVEYIETFYLPKNWIFTLLTLWDYSKTYFPFLELSIPSVEYKVRPFGIPFLRNERFGRIYNMKINGVPFEESKTYLKVAASRSLISMMEVVPKDLSKGYVQITPLDRFGNKQSSTSTRITEMMMFSKCLEKLDAWRILQRKLTEK